MGLNRLFKGSSGFNLIEVMVALAILALSFTALILAQVRTTKLAISGRNITIATTLARMKLMECKREVKKQIAAISDFESSGDFSEEGFPQFSFECHAPKFNVKPPSASELDEGLKKRTGEASKEKKPEMNMGLAGSIIELVTDNLSDAIRELCVIIRWKDGNADEEMRVVTHVIDTLPMGRLALILSKQADGSASKPEKPKEQLRRPADEKADGSGELR